MTNILDGKKVANETKKDISESLKSTDSSPTLAAVLVGENPASKKYLELKDKDCTEVGIGFENFKLSSDASLKEVTELITQLNQDNKYDGIIVQMPVPEHLDQLEIIKSIDPEKDVDGLHPLNVGKLWLSDYKLQKDLIPCTPKGIITLLNRYKIDLEGKKTVIINRSNLVGKPLSKLMLDKNATLTICHSRTKDIKSHTLEADILITAVGNRLDFVLEKDMVSDGVIIVDVGMNYIEGNLYGDVAFDNVKEKSSHITPVPGGVGPMTRVSLLENVMIAGK